MLKKLGLGLFALAISAGGAFAQSGAFSQFPTVGVPADTECLSYGNNNVCNQYRPAGPTSLTGAETVPADTNVVGGGTQTVRIPGVMFGAGATTFNAPLTGASITLTAGTSNLVLNPAGTIAALTVVLPAASTLANNQTLKIGSSQIVTALTLTGGTGTTIVGGATTIAAAGGFELIYIETNATTGIWYRLQ